MPKRTHLAAALLLALTLVTACNRKEPTPTPRIVTPRPSPAPLQLPAFEPDVCPTTISDEYAYECGRLLVLEDRTKPEGRVVRLPVVIFKSRSDHPAPDPVIYLPEGGGYSQVHEYEQILDTMGAAILEERDLILYNQRGSRQAQPHLICTDYDAFVRDIYARSWGQLELNMALIGYWHGCYSQLRERDLDLNMYSSAANAADADDLRIALGYEQANYYARSYGTRIALDLVRDYPEGVRSLILDAAYPPQVGYYSEHAGNANRAFNELFESCSEDACCRERYPDLRETFFQVVNRLNLQPLRIQYPKGPVMVNGDMFMQAIYTGLLSKETIPRLPQVIYDATDDDLVALENTFLDNLRAPLANQAVFFAAQCREEAPFDSYEDVQERAADLPPQVGTLFGESWAHFHYTICDFWRFEPADPVENEPVVSGVPTLVLAGQFDPIFSPEWGRQAAETLENSYFYEVPGESHGVMGANDCTLAIGLSFLDDPTREPEVSCLDALPPPNFAPDLPVPRFEPSTCYFNYAPGRHRVECGYLVVPEDRSRPDGPTVKLHVAIFKSSSIDPAPDPVIYVSGGGGGNHLDGYQIYLENGGYEILEDRDYIMYNQRGTRYGHPELACPGYSAFLRGLAMERDLTMEERSARHIAFLLDCHDDLKERGIRLEAYNSTVNAADLNDLRIALGYDQVNLYGTSYGPRIILETLRNYPEGVRSAILDSVYPPQADLYVEYPHNARRAFEALFDDCAADPDCHTQYPNLEATFYRVVDELNASPYAFGSIWINGYDFMEAVYEAMYSVESIPYLPQWIDQAGRGDHSGLRWYYERLLRPGVFEQVVAHGVHYSILCNEEAPFSDPAAALALEAQLPSQIREWLPWPPEDVVLCESWDAGVADPGVKDPVYSDVPTLIFAGRYDPITPPAWGRQTAETLENGYFYEFPANGHGVMRANRCALEMGLQFLDDPLAAPDAACMRALTRPDFE